MMASCNKRVLNAVILKIMVVVRYIILSFIVFCGILFSCNKKAEKPPSSNLTGKWVLEPDNKVMDDTLIFYQHGDSTIFFDKSVYFMTNMAAWTTENAFKYNYRMDLPSPDSIRTQKVNTTNPDVWLNIYFKQISANEIEIGNFRAANPPDEKYRYKKVD